MNVEILREFILFQKYVTEDMPFGPDVLCFRIGGKIFGFIPLNEDPARINLKCDPERVDELRSEYACIRPGYHMNKRHWNTVLLEGDATWELIKELTIHSYDLVYQSLSKKVKSQLTGNG